MGIGVNFFHKGLPCSHELYYEEIGLANRIKNTSSGKISAENLKPFQISGMMLCDYSGKVLFNKDVPFHSSIEEYIFGSTYIAVKILIKNSFHSQASLKDFEYGNFRILVENGGKLCLVAIGRGDFTASVRETMKRTINSINMRYGEAISCGIMDMDTLKNVGREIDGLIKSGNSMNHQDDHLDENYRRKP